MPERAMEETAAAVKRPMRSPEPAPHAHMPAPGAAWDAAGARAPGAPSAVLAIQRAAGNQAVMRMLDAQRPGHPLAGPSTAVQRSSENELDDEDDVQRSAAALHEPSDEAIRSAAAEGVRTPSTTLPHLDRIQASFGRHSIAHVQAHVGPEAARASRAMNALAYASGNHVVFGATPDLRTAAHEAAHIVQQQAGVQLSGGIGRAGDPYERHADTVADAVVAGRSAGELLEPFAASAAPVQSRNRIPEAAHVGAHQGTVPKEAAAAARRGGAADTIQPMRLWKDLKKVGTGIKWTSHRTQPNPQDEATEEKYRAKGYGAPITGRPSAPSEWKSKITAEAAPKSQGSATITAERLGPDVKEGAKVPDPPPMAWTAFTALKLAHPKFKAVTVLPRSLGGNGAELAHVVFLRDDIAKQLRERVDATLKAIVTDGMAWVELEANTVYVRDMVAKLMYASSVTVAFIQLDSKGERISGTRRIIKVIGQQPSDPGSAGTAGQKSIPKLGKPDPNAAVRWRTRVKFKPTHDPTGDGTGVEANPLGPDHKLGEEPSGDNDVIWKLRTKYLHERSGKKTTYIAGHLLNHHLGGPGNDARNLAPIPASVNSNHSQKVEQPLKEIVNKKHGWVYYKVEVAHGTQHGVDYPSELKCTWYQLDRFGEPYESEHKVTFTIRPPLQAGSNPDPEVISGTTRQGHHPAQARIAYDEVILDAKETLRDQRAFMNQLINVLHKLGVNKYILEEDASTLENPMVLVHAVVPNPAEVDALKELKSQLGSWEKSSRNAASTATAYKQATNMVHVIADARKKQSESQKNLIKRLGDQVDSQTVEDVNQSVATAEETWSNSLKVMSKLLDIAFIASEQVKAKDAELQDAREQIKTLNREKETLAEEKYMAQKESEALKNLLQQNQATVAALLQYIDELKNTNQKQTEKEKKKKSTGKGPKLMSGERRQLNSKRQQEVNEDNHEPNVTKQSRLDQDPSRAGPGTDDGQMNEEQ